MCERVLFKSKNVCTSHTITILSLCAALKSVFKNALYVHACAQ